MTSAETTRQTSPGRVLATYGFETMHTGTNNGPVSAASNVVKRAKEGGTDPFLNDDFHAGESFLEGLSVGGAAGKCRTSGAPRLVYHAPSAYALG